MSSPQWQRWTITVPAGRHRTHMSTCDMAFDAYVPNLYPEESMMRTLVEQAGFSAVMEYGDPPARGWDRERALDECRGELEGDTHAV